MFGWLKKNLKNVLLAASLVTNALGYTGVIKPGVADKVGTVIRTVDAVGDTLQQR